MIILGKSEAMITMILDNLESQDNFCRIGIINNLNLCGKLPFENNKFSIYEETDLPDEIQDKEFALGVYSPIMKIKIFKLFDISMNRFSNIIHKSSQISSTSKLGNGILINSLVSIASYSEIGNFVTVNRNSSIGHHTIIEDFVTINPGVTICGNIKIGKKTFIGAGSVIKDGITIGEDCIVGAGSIVVKDIDNGIKGCGNPFKSMLKSIS